MRYEKWVKDWKTALAENFYLKILCILLALGLILNATVFKKKERVIVAPPKITKEFWVESDKASPSYVEQMGVFFATLGGNLTPDNAGYNVDVLSQYLPTDRFNEVKAELVSQATYIKKNNITQAFFPKAIKLVDEKSVIVEGTVIRNIGTIKVSQENMVFHVKLRLNNYELQLDEFFVDYPDRKKQELINKGEITGEDKKF